MKLTDGLSLERNVERTVYAPSVYNSHNETEAALAWDSVLPGHGLVAIDPLYAEKHNLPETMKLPGNSARLVYIIEAYHAMHCTVREKRVDTFFVDLPSNTEMLQRILRTHYMALLKGSPWNWSIPHDIHCFDAMRQYIMCNPDDTLLYTTGNRDAGHNQKKKCKDWDNLRNWAEERTASYYDDFEYSPNSTANNLWDNYHYGDGLPVGRF